MGSPPAISRSASVYRGRFAPSPTGPLHFGSLVAAVGSYLEARSHGGEWLVRIEDVDRPRIARGAANAILRSLAALGMQWDGAVVHQSDRHDAYHAALHRLRSAARVYPCACSRREIADSALSGIEGYVYPGTCRAGPTGARAARAWRVIAPETRVGFEDALQGAVEQHLAREIGDFVLYRADGVYSYQLAVTVDDAAQGITHVVRGADLLESTPRQIHLQRMLGFATPHYAHLPVAVNAHGEKLSKQTLAEPIDTSRGGAVLLDALAFLGHPAPRDLQKAPLTHIWGWAFAHWRFERVPRLRSQLVSAAPTH